MRVLMTADAIGGVWGYSMELARALAPEGIELVIATMGDAPSAAQRAEAAELRNVTLVDSTFRLEWMPQPWPDVDRAGEWLLGLERDFSPHVVHLNGYAHAALPFRAPRIVVAHSCVFSWWRAVHGQNPPRDEWQTYFERVREGLASADLLIAPSWSMLDELRAIYGMSGAPQRVIHNTRDGRFFAAEKEPFVLAAGRLWDEGKNIATLARAARSLPWPVRVAGALGEASLEGVQWLGSLTRDELAGQYARASIYCLPARYEPFGLTVLEAALSSCALVLGDIASLRELWDGAALFVPPDDEETLRAALLALICDPALCRDLGAQARTRAQAFDPRTFGCRYLAAYQELRREVLA
ncbi:MAG TPA: glycosyltransferase family 4 protein [Thermoanaerobaculia bacterium]|jgi:glycosyltransferase involved in cell wall biosynthesis|nr:glycosyltransferase family 4 protein [Thermoanaerobaculia bacterium]